VAIRLKWNESWTVDQNGSYVGVGHGLEWTLDWPMQCNLLEWAGVNH